MKMDPSSKLECVSLLLVHGLVDGELDENHALIAEQHLRTCLKCTAEYESTRNLKDMFASKQLRYRAPETLRAKAVTLLEAERSAFSKKINEPAVCDRRNQTRFWASIQVFAIAASVLLFLTLNVSRNQLEDEVVASHLAALATRLTDISTLDSQALGPWFANKLAFAPSVVDLTDKGFRLAGARLDRVGAQTAAAIVYRHGTAVIDLFIWPSDPESTGTESRQGYNLIHWTEAGLKFCAISRLDQDTLQKFQESFSIAMRL
jgi:anti-sigma factor RsiW